MGRREGEEEEDEEEGRISPRLLYSIELVAMIVSYGIVEIGWESLIVEFLELKVFLEYGE